MPRVASPDSRQRRSSKLAPSRFSHWPTILVIEEPTVRQLLKTRPRMRGYRALAPVSIAEAVSCVDAEAPDLVILGLRDDSGIELVRKLKTRTSAPIIVLSARFDNDMKIAALESGADDYLVRPFHRKDLLARVEMALRRSYHARGRSTMLVSGDILVDVIYRLVSVRGKRIALKPKEYEILLRLTESEGNVLGHREIVTAIWGAPGPRHIQDLRAYIASLRTKIERDPARPARILTEHGVGYRFARV